MNQNKVKVTRLRAERLKQGLTLQQVGDAVGLSRDAVKKIEMLQRQPSLKNYRKLAEFYAIDPRDDLLEVISIDPLNTYPHMKFL